jgi:hypothetical protein
MGIEIVSHGIAYVRPFTVPTSVPPGSVLVHNGIAHTPVSTRGFRVWTQRPDRTRLRIYRCGWAPRVLRHYRVNLAPELA